MKLKFPLFFITLGIFGIINTELGVVGILPMIMDKYKISATAAGMLVSSFAFIIALFGPWMTLLFSKINQRKVMIGIMALFALSNLASAAAPSFQLLLLFRVVPALFHPVYFSLAFSAAASLSGKETAAKASAKVFLGVSIGMVLGIPLTSYIASQLSLSSSFIFSAIVNSAACLGIALMVPDTLPKNTLSFRSQLGILRKPSLWLNIGAASLIFASMFSVYSYFSEYMTQRFNMTGATISILLVMFGASGVLGNWYAGKLLSARLKRTVLFYPIVLGLSYLLLQVIHPSILLIGVIIILWGAAHTSGLIVSQVWLTSESPEAPEFSNSLYVSFSNMGVTLGTAFGGWILAGPGIYDIVFGGILFAFLAFICIFVRIQYFKKTGDSTTQAEE